MIPTVTPLRTSGRAPRVLTIDVEDWFHVCGDDYYSDPRGWDRFVPRVETTMALLFRAIERGGHRATLFFLGWIAARYPDLVREAVRRGHEVGVHGDLHRRADEMDAEEFRADLLAASAKIQAAGAPPPRVHRAAEWSIRRAADPALEVLAREGYACDASMTRVPPLGDAANDPGPQKIGFGEAGPVIVEMPPLTGAGFGRNLLMGGGWAFRMFPPGRVAATESGFRDRGWPAIFTFHPWEVDPDHPPMEGISPLGRLVHFYRRASTLERLERWLDPSDPCAAVSDALSKLERLAA
jgi:polysaccharide deacetylase family protein (PEP-CTERM system associated)